jgi:hypothetical protein
VSLAPAAPVRLIRPLTLCHSVLLNLGARIPEAAILLRRQTANPNKLPILAAG